MTFSTKIRRRIFVFLTIVMLVFLAYYMREFRFMVNKDTRITIEFNNRDITLSADEDKEFKDILNSARLHRAISVMDGQYFNNSTIFIRILNTDNHGKTSGMMTVCLDKLSKSDFSGSEPNGRFRVNRTDLQKIVDFLSPIIELSDT